MTEVMSDWDAHMDELETPTPASLVCVVCRIMHPAAEMDTDFGYDAWGRRYGAGICRGCALPGPTVMSADDDLAEEIRR